MYINNHLKETAFNTEKVTSLRYTLQCNYQFHIETFQYDVPERVGPFLRPSSLMKAIPLQCREVQHFQDYIEWTVIYRSTIRVHYDSISPELHSKTTIIQHVSHHCLSIQNISSSDTMIHMNTLKTDESTDEISTKVISSGLYQFFFTTDGKYPSQKDKGPPNLETETLFKRLPIIIHCVSNFTKRSQGYPGWCFRQSSTGRNKKVRIRKLWVQVNQFGKGWWVIKYVQISLPVKIYLIHWFKCRVLVQWTLVKGKDDTKSSPRQYTVVS